MITCNCVVIVASGKDGGCTRSIVCIEQLLSDIPFLSSRLSSYLIPFASPLPVHPAARRLTLPALRHSFRQAGFYFTSFLQV